MPEIFIHDPKSANPFEDFAALYREKRRLDAELRKVNGEIAKAEVPLVEKMLGAGVQNVGLATGETVYLESRYFARIRKAGEKLSEDEKRRAVEAFETAGLEHLVTLESSSLRSFVRELEGDLPPELAAVVDVGEEAKLRVRKR